MREIIATIGSIGAVACSWTVNQSIGWAILHFFCGWIYIVYWAFMYTPLYTCLQTLAGK